MTTTKSSIKNTGPDLKIICRLCLQPEKGSINIFESQLSIPVRIMACAALEVQPTDGLPGLICEKCRYQLEVSYVFRKKCQISDAKLRKHIRLLNAGKISRIFQKSNSEDDDEDDEELQFGESKKFIEAEDERKKTAENEKQQKWLEEEREKIRREECEKMFEEFENFVQVRKNMTIITHISDDSTDCTKRDEVRPVPKKQQQKKEHVQEAPRSHIKPISIHKKQQKREYHSEVDADNEITSSEQITDHQEKEQEQEQEEYQEQEEDLDHDEYNEQDQHQENENEQEQAMVYSDDGGDGDSSENQIIRTFLIFDGKSNSEESRDINPDQNDEVLEYEESLNQEDGDEGDAPDENNLDIKPHQVSDDMDEYIFADDFDDSNNCDGKSGQPNVINSYQIEENGEIQYLKDEKPDELSMTDEELDAITPDNTDLKYTIEKCNTIPTKKYGRKQQHQAKSPIGEILATVVGEQVSTNDLKIFKCSDCPQSFTRAGSLLRHRSAHKGGREYCCDYCEKHFSCKSSLDRHIRIHTGEKPFTCEQCGKNFMQKEILKRHLTIHTGERPHRCPHCPRSFVQKLLMMQHINSTHLEVPLIMKHVCHLCPKSFIHPSGLSRHLLTHKGQVFTCSKCARSFNDKSSLRRHFTYLHKDSQSDINVDHLFATKTQ